MAIDAAQLRARVGLDYQDALSGLRSLFRGFQDTGQAAQQSSPKIQKLSQDITFQERALQILKTQLDATVQARGVDSTQAQQQQLRYDRLKASIDANAQALKRAEAEQLRANSTWGRVEGLLSGAGGQMLQYAGAIGIANTAAQLITGTVSTLSESFQQAAQTAQRAGVFTALIQDGPKATRILQEGAAFAERFKIKQGEVTASLQSVAGVLRESTASGELAVSVLKRMELLSPEQGIEGAALALKELDSGQVTSLVQRFEVSRTKANELKAAIESGADTFQVLDKYLTETGLTMATLEQQTTGAAGAQRAYEKSVDDLRQTLGEAISEEGTAYYNLLTRINGALAEGIGRPVQARNDQDDVLSNANDYAEYSKQIAEVNTKLAENSGWEERLGQQYRVLTEEQFAYAKGLMESGVGATEATQRAKEHAEALGRTKAGLDAAAQAGRITSEQQELLSHRMERVSQMGTVQTQTVANLSQMLGEGKQTIAQTNFALSMMEQAYTAATTKAEEHATATQNVITSDDKLAGLAGRVGEALTRQAEADQQYRDQVERQATEHERNLQDIEDDGQDAREDAREAYNERLGEIDRRGRKQREKLVDEAERRQGEIVARAAEARAKADEDYRDRRLDITASSNTQLRELAIEHDQEVRDLDTEAQAARGALEADHQQRLIAIATDGQQRRADAEQEHQEALRHIERDGQQRRADAEQEHQQRLVQLDQEAGQRRVAAGTEHQEALRDIERDGQQRRGELERDLGRRLTELEREHGRTLRGLRTEHEQQLGEIADDAVRDRESLAREHEQRLTDIVDDGELRRAELRRKRGRDAEDDERDRENKIRDLTIDHQRKLADLDVQLAGARGSKDRQEVQLRIDAENQRFAQEIADAERHAGDKQTQRDIDHERSLTDLADAQARQQQAEADAYTARQRELEDTLRQETDAEQNAYLERIQKAGEALDLQRQQAQEKQQQQLDDLRSTLEQQRQAEAAAHVERLAAVDIWLQEQRTKTDAAYTASLTAIETQLQEARTKEQQSHLDRLNDLQKSLADARTAEQDSYVQRGQELTDKLAADKQKADDAYKGQLDDLRQSLFDQRLAAKESYDQQLLDLDERLESETGKLQTETGRRLKEHQDGLNEQRQQAVDSYAEQLKDLDEALGERIKKENERYDEQQKQAQAAYDTQRKDLQKGLGDQLNAYIAYYQDLNQLTDAQAAAIRAKLQGAYKVDLNASGQQQAIITGQLGQQTGQRTPDPRPSVGGIRGAAPRARGGRFSRDQLLRVGEEGEEFVIFDQGGYVVSHQDAVAAVRDGARPQTAVQRRRQDEAQELDQIRALEIQAARVRQDAARARQDALDSARPRTAQGGGTGGGATITVEGDLVFPNVQTAQDADEIYRALLALRYRSGPLGLG